MVDFGDVVNAAGGAAKAVGDGVVAAGKAVNDAMNETAGSAADIVNSAFGGDTRAQAQTKIDALEAKAAAKQAQERLERQQQGLDVSGNDPTAIRGHDNWDSWSHQDLCTFRDSLKFGQMQESGQAWTDLGKELSEIFADLDKEVRSAAGDGMRGEAADAGMNAARPLQEWGRAFGDSVTMNGLKIQEAAATAEQTSRSIQDPSEPSTARQIIVGGASAATMGVAGAADAGLRMKEQEEDAKRARAVAKNVFTPGYDNVDASTAALPPPRNPLTPPPKPPPTKRPTDDSTSQDQTMSVQDSNPSTPTSSSVDSGSVPSAPDGSSRVAPSVPSPSTPAGSDSAWARPTPPMGTPPGVQQPGGPPGGGGAQPPTPVGITPGMGGGGAGAGRGVAGGAGAARGGAATPGAGGRAGAGAVGGARPGATTAGAAGAAGSAGARGAAGGVGAGAGRGAGGGGEDEEHERPSWLEESDEIFMNDMPKVAPPVFGE